MTKEQNKLKEIQEKVYQPVIKGTPRMCPFKPAIPTQGELGQLNFIQIPCTNQCALFHATATNELTSMEVDFKCSNQPHKLKFLIEPLKPVSPLTIN